MPVYQETKTGKNHPKVPSGKPVKSLGNKGNLINAETESDLEETAHRESDGSRLGPAEAFALQETIGNRAVQRLISRRAAQSTFGSASKGQIFRYVEYNEEVEGGRFTDPEQAMGTLPFNEGGWNADEIAQDLTQLNTAVAHNDNVRCVETSFLVSMIMRGPGAVREMIENYLARYRLGLSQASTPADIKRWYRRSLANLGPLPAKIDNKTLAYEDLSTLMTEMYSVYGEGAGGTEEGPEANMMRREGYTVTSVHKENVTQEQAATEAQALAPGENLACGVEVSRAGTAAINHRITIGRKPGEGGTLYLYDPWPVAGEQMEDTDENLEAVNYYFTNRDTSTVETGETTEGGEAETATVEVITARHFSIDLKYSPPKEKTEGA